MRIRRRLRRGLSLFGSLLAMALLGTLILSVVVWLEDRALEERERTAGTQLETMGHAVSSYVNSNFVDVLGSVPREIARSELSLVLPVGFGDTDALGRELKVYAIAGPDADSVDVLVAQVWSDLEDTLVPSAALLAPGYGGVRMGVVWPDAPTMLQGPTIRQSVSGFQSAFGGDPQAGALAVFARFNHESVFGSQLYRIEIPGFPDGNVLETNLDLGGNDIVDAGMVGAERLEVVEDIETGGELIVTGALMVGQAVNVTGKLSVSGEMTADRGTFLGAVKAESLEAVTSVEAVTVTATGTVTAETVSVFDSVSAGSANLDNLVSSIFDAGVVTATDVTAERLSSGSLETTGDIRALTAGISRLVVGSCSGC